MVKLDLSEPLINGFIIFLNDTSNHSFAIQFFLIQIEFLNHFKYLPSKLPEFKEKNYYYFGLSEASCFEI